MSYQGRVSQIDMMIKAIAIYCTNTVQFIEL